MAALELFNNIRYRTTPSRNSNRFNTMASVSKYSVGWTHSNGTHMYADMHSVGPYTYAQILEGQGCSDIKIYFKGELIDNYVQGRSTRNISNLQDPE